MKRMRAEGAGLIICQMTSIDSTFNSSVIVGLDAIKRGRA